MIRICLVLDFCSLLSLSSSSPQLDEGGEFRDLEREFRKAFFRPKMGIPWFAGLITICLPFCFSSVPIVADAYSKSMPHKTSIFHLFGISESPSHPPDHAVRKHHGKSHNNARSPSISITPAVSPSVFPRRHHHWRSKFRSSAPEPAYNRQVSPIQSPSPSPSSSSAPAPAPNTPPDHFYGPILPPFSAPLGPTKNGNSPLSPVLTLPPPPPNQDCSPVTCTEPLTYTLPGSPCGCVWPIQVKLSLGVGIYTFFPLVSMLTAEIAKSVSLNLSQVRVMGADAASQQLDQTTVIINLIPKGLVFNYSTAFSIYQKFWQGKISINASIFGAYSVLYVHYPGLPPSPPSSSFTTSTIDNGPNRGDYNGGNTIKPLGADVPRRSKEGHGANMIVVIILSSVAAFVLCVVFIWILILKFRPSSLQPKQFQHAPTPSVEKQGNGGSGPGSALMSSGSGAITYTGSAKNFSIKELERATSNFSAARILGEGGFGLVYRGILDDGREVAVKVLKRDDQHGTREFLAEVEMLSRLHHRNLVKLIGISTEDQTRCLIYELVPNGSVESRLHGIDKETDPLDWDSRMKIALGAARGLAYLHEDSNPRVIHRDFKSSNILLEHDFTPKVADFGLARTALEENKHISTHVMGTFGYLAPEYAMTGHLLVKSDVYSYGVVLLELLTGRKPVDLSLPPGQENLVTWARPLLSSKEALETIIDANIKSDISFDSLAKVAAIASMCVQPEVSHRPFMGEVVQALKLVCNEFDEAKQLGGSSFSQDEFTGRFSTKLTSFSGEINANLEESDQSKPFPAGGIGLSKEAMINFSASDLLSSATGVERNEFESFRWFSASEPLRTGRSKRHFWQRLRIWSRGSMSEHGFASKFLSGLH